MLAREVHGTEKQHSGRDIPILLLEPLVNPSQTIAGLPPAPTSP